MHIRPLSRAAPPVNKEDRTAATPVLRDARVILLEPERFWSLARAAVDAVGGQTRAVKLLAELPPDSRVTQSTLSRVYPVRKIRKAQLLASRGIVPPALPSPGVVSPALIESLEFLAEHTDPLRATPEVGARLRAALRAASGGPYRRLIENQYRRWLRAEIDGYFDRDLTRWVRTPRGLGSLPWKARTSARELRMRAFVQLRRFVDQEWPELAPDLESAIFSRGYDPGRVLVAWVRILEPLLQYHDSALIEIDWRDLTKAKKARNSKAKTIRSSLEKIVRDGVWREKVLIEKLGKTFAERANATSTRYEHSATATPSDPLVADAEDDPETYRMKDEAVQYVRALVERMQRGDGPRLIPSSIVEGGGAALIKHLRAERRHARPASTASSAKRTRAKSPRTAASPRNRKGRRRAGK